MLPKHCFTGDACRSSQPSDTKDFCSFPLIDSLFPTIYLRICFFSLDIVWEMGDGTSGYLFLSMKTFSLRELHP